MVAWPLADVRFVRMGLLMIQTLRTAGLQNLVLIALMIYLLGAATPVLLLRFAARDAEDSCYLTVMLYAILLTFSILLAVVIF